METKFHPVESYYIMGVNYNTSKKAIKIKKKMKKAVFSEENIKLFYETIASRIEKEV